MTQNNKCKIILNLAHRNGKILNDIECYYCIIVARFLTIMYTNQTFRVLLCSHLTNGVKQRGVMYPLLFTVYVDDLAEYGPPGSINKPSPFTISHLYDTDYTKTNTKILY